MPDIFKKKDALEMSYRDFKLWCSERACDGCWSQLTATVCLSVINVVDHVPVWKRKKEWAHWHDFVVNEFVKPTNAAIDFTF